ncbi:prolactin regulatory element-binding protein-like [Paramacrobiotus metropolitanus]|uniref:prolactin regulatory element-binding protein-like n=1 Tax=Paramacrobiotus metropolitanus TaxID=2943436 RepID=UPI0024459525|nr:prolactin regulatory element-binding protein-like [Paramacrobiotus metropolitanus]
MRDEGKPVTIDELDIPIFFVKRLGDRQFVIGGGGGSSKTGVPNVVYLFSLTNRNGKTFLRQSQKVDVGSGCPRNIAVYEITSSSRSPIVLDPRPRLLEARNKSDGVEEKTQPGGSQLRSGAVLTKAERVEKEMRLLLDNARELIAVGMDNLCGIYQVQRSLCKGIQQENGAAGEPGPAIVSKDDLLTISFREQFETVAGVDATQQCCVFLPPDPTKRSNVQYDDPAQGLSPDANLATGGSDGFIRIWDAAEFDELFNIKAHDDEVVDMDLSFTGDEVVTCGRDNKAHVWQLKTGKRIASPLPEFPEAKVVDYRPRQVRFHAKDSAVLYAIWVPLKRQRPRPQPSVICMYRFRTSKLALVVSTPVKGDLLCALTVSPCGYYVACGNLDGDVRIFRSDNLSLIYSAVQAHGTFVTDLEFTDCTFGAKILTQTSNAQCTVFSVSADRKIVMHQADFLNATLRKWKRYMKIIPLIWLVIVLFTQLMDYIGYFELEAAQL